MLSPGGARGVERLNSTGTLIQTTTTEAPKLSAEATKRIDDNAALIDQLTTEIRTISHLLHPPLLDEVGLSSALRWCVEGFAQRSKIAATLDMPEHMERFPADMEIAIFRAVQECLKNVHRHSGSRSCAVKVFQDQTDLHVEIRDEGRGIPNERLLALTSSGGGVGLRGMQERIRQLGGTLSISSLGIGTTVSVSPQVVAPQSEGAA
jgi:signal transduction histidine kinase